LANEPVVLSTTDALRRLAKGPDDCAWTTVLDRHGVEILRATQRILGDPMSAEDACQETLLQIRDRAAQFRGRPGAPDAMARNWIMRIACNTALHMLRQRRRLRQRELNVARETPQSVDAVDLNGGPNDELAQRVRAELAELPEKQRLPLMLHFFAGLDYEQISSELRCGVGAARVRVHRALEKLRERMAAVGVLLTAAALYALLAPSHASAGEMMMDPERYARWHGLLLSSQQAAINVVTDPSFTAVSKIGYAAATAAIAGSVAFSYSHKAPEKPTPAPSLTPAVMQASSVAAECQPPPAPPSFQGGENGGGASRQSNPTIDNVPKQNETAAAKPPRSSPPLEKGAPGGSATHDSQVMAASRHDTLAAREAQAATEKADNELVSRLTQLEMLRMMQHELNVRVARIDEDIESHGTVTADDQTRLRRAADDQAEISNLLRRIADELQYAQNSETKQAGLGK
jgi:RNA polymerase sigma factor (sigma-70 family)